MRLSELIEGLEEAELEGEDVQVSGLCSDTRTLNKGEVFFCLKGQHYHGNQFVHEAVQKGAVAVVTDSVVSGLPVPQIVVKDTLEAMAYMASRFYGEPSKKQKVIGVTGTNGKTTSAWLIYNILKRANWPVAVLGTIRYLMPDGKEERASLTTPLSIKWQALLKEALDRGARATVAEVSSHGLALKRVNWTSFTVSLFTNLSRDHMDFHRDMEEYFQAKAQLFRRWTQGPWVINTDDPYGAKLAMEAGPKLVSYGLNPDAMYRAVDWNLDLDGIRATVQEADGSYELHSPLIGKVNLYNILGALAVVRSLGIDRDVAVQALRHTGPVEGRLQRIPNDRGVTVIIDYAHTPDALEKVLQTLRPLTSGRLITLFGCGGNRDRGKRPLMGEVASRLSDLVVVTSDNPRWENPQEIIKDIIEGIKNDNYKVIPDRAEAIAEALAMARPGDTVLIAGKGHEDYQEVKGQRFHFSDHERVLEVLRTGGTT